MTTSNTPSTIAPKISMFKAKSGFVIPKNKLSGSLVPTFKGGKKPDGGDVTSNDGTKQVQRKTRWAPDLSQDASVRRGRSLAYQTRVDQITQQLKSESLTSEMVDRKLTSALSAPSDAVLAKQTEKLQQLEVEKREVIGEILKLNPSYKAPPDFKPILKEATVPIPVKDRPGYNFVGLILGTEGENQRRLEKETGASVEVYGTKMEVNEKVKLMASEENESLSSFDELFVQVTAETYDKVDAAVALIELLLSSIMGKPPVSSATAVGSGDDVNTISKGQDVATSPGTSAPMQTQGLIQPTMGSMMTAPGQQYPGAWYQSNPSGPLAVTHSSASAVSNLSYPTPYSAHPSTTPVMFAPRPSPGAAFGSGPQSTPVAGQRAQPFAPGLQRSFMPQNFPFGQNLPPPVPSGHIPPRPDNLVVSSFHGSQQSVGPPMGPVPFNSPLSHLPPNIPSGSLHDRPVSTSVSYAGWLGGPGGTSQSFGRSHMADVHSPMSSSMPVGSGPPHGTPITTQHAGLPVSPLSSAFHGHPFVPSQVQNSSPMQPYGVQSMAYSSQNPLLGSSFGTSEVGLRSLPHAPRFSPASMAISAPRPPQPSPGDFTFQPHRPNGPPLLSNPGPNSQSLARGFPPSPMQPSAHQAPSFQPGLHNPAQRPLMRGLPGPQVGNPMGLRLPISPGPIGGNFGPKNLNPLRGAGNTSPAAQPQMANDGGPLPSRPGMQHAYASASFGAGRQTASPSGAQQVYDPFTSSLASNAPRTQDGEPVNAQKQDNDPEYEDLMASVGVK